jgi:hypothetical protein
VTLGELVSLQSFPVISVYFPNLETILGGGSYDSHFTDEERPWRVRRQLEGAVASAPGLGT